jgi:hypothetical protein
MRKEPVVIIMVLLFGIPSIAIAESHHSAALTMKQEDATNRSKAPKPKPKPPPPPAPTFHPGAEWEEYRANLELYRIAIEEWRKENPSQLGEYRLLIDDYSEGIGTYRINNNKTIDLKVEGRDRIRIPSGGLRRNRN